MTLDEKIRYGTLTLSGASLVLASLGLHLSPIEITSVVGIG